MKILVFFCILFFSCVKQVTNIDNSKKEQKKKIREDTKIIFRHTLEGLNEILLNKQRYIILNIDTVAGFDTTYYIKCIEKKDW